MVGVGWAWVLGFNLYRRGKMWLFVYLWLFVYTWLFVYLWLFVNLWLFVSKLVKSL